MSVRTLCIAALVLASCGAALPAVSPTPPGAPLSIAELKYRVMDAGGRIEFCDPDFYPIARTDERELAQQHIGEIQADADTYAAIASRVGTDALAVYRDWKALRALVFGQLTFGSPTTPQVYPFSYRSTGSPTATSAKSSGVQVEGNVGMFGNVSITRRTTVGPLNCPICLARGTRIATPTGDVAVEDLRVGDTVWTQGERGERAAAPLVAIGSAPVPPTHEVVHLVLDDGRDVLVSPGHPTADGRHAGDLRAGDALDGASVLSAELEPYGGGATFDVLPAGPTGAYWANGILLGSTLARPQLPTSSFVRNATIRP
ncbi:MAG TPA: Hint domain-containing protein [Candidatus Limnocylindria bacterium]